MITISPDKVVTIWAGFGGAITEAAAYNYSLLPKARQQAFLRAYFDKSGLNYNWGRISIGSNDFCLAPYEYTGDPKLEDFSTEHEERYVLPLLRDIFKLRELNLIASPWSPPSFMKSNHSLIGGRLKRRFYKTYAAYLKLFLEDYKKRGFKVDFLTIQNEPEARQRWESCVWNLREQQKFLDYLLPMLDDTKVLLWDHNKEKLFKVVNELYRPEVAGVGFHIYSGLHPEQLRLTREKYPELLMVNTEACTAFAGSWQSATEYLLTDVMTDINCGVNAYLDWNLLLDQDGGPNDAKNPVKATVMLSKDRKDFVLTPIYNYLKVLAEALPVGSKILQTTCSDDGLLAVAGVYKQKKSVVIMNKSDKAKKYTIKIEGGNSMPGTEITGMLTAHSIIKR